MPDTRLPANNVKRRLNRALRLALTGTKKSQVFVELFSGAGVLAREVEKASGFACLRFDVKLGLEFDLCNQDVVLVLLGWIAARLVRGAWIGAPCSTWSRARRRPLRDSLHIYGRDGLNANDLFKVRVGNATLAAARRVIRSCSSYGVPCILENPATSQMWSEPQLRALLELPSANAFCLDYCCFGAPWRKRTRLAGWHCSEPLGLRRLCTGHDGKCWTGKRHRLLQGSVPGSSLCWTHLAEAYPVALAAAAGRWLAQAADQRHLLRLQQLTLH
eukprot:6323253-Lingulodinium_polyedra.AAC.1